MPQNLRAGTPGVFECVGRHRQAVEGVLLVDGGGEPEGPPSLGTSRRQPPGYPDLPSVISGQAAGQRANPAPLPLSSDRETIASRRPGESSHRPNRTRVSGRFPPAKSRSGCSASRAELRGKAGRLAVQGRSIVESRRTAARSRRKPGVPKRRSSPHRRAPRPRRPAPARPSRPFSTAPAARNHPGRRPPPPPGAAPGRPGAGRAPSEKRRSTVAPRSLAGAP